MSTTLAVEINKLIKFNMYLQIPYKKEVLENVPIFFLNI